MFLAKLLMMMARQQLPGQMLERVTEPSQLTDSHANVVQYGQVMVTKLVAAYAGGLAVLDRSIAFEGEHVAADLACGPGLYTLCLAECFPFTSIRGIDLSAPMVEAAGANASRQGLSDRVSFSVDDATDLTCVADHTIDLASCTDALHHMPDLATVRRVLREMVRITKPDGLIMAMDLVRLRSHPLTEDYVRTLGDDYLDRGLSSFYDDFRNSMFAAWTADEMYEAIPRDSGRWWCQLVPRGLPTVQIVLGLPIGRKQPFVRRAFGGGPHPMVEKWFPVWEAEVGPKWARQTRGDCRIVVKGLDYARRRFVGP